MTARTAPLVLAGLLTAACAATPPEEPGRPGVPEKSFDADGRRVPSARTLLVTARVLAARGDDPRCEVVLRRLVSDHPGFAPAYNELAELHLRWERLDDAVAVLQEGLEAAPEDLVLWNNLGMCHLLARRYGAAADAFAEAARLDPRNQRTRANLAVAVGMEGRFDEAFRIYSGFLTKSKAHQNVAVLARAAGDEERADRESFLASASAP